MDKVSVVLIVGILFFVLLSGSIVYKRWIDNEVRYEVVIVKYDTFEDFKAGVQ